MRRRLSIPSVIVLCLLGTGAAVGAAPATPQRWALISSPSVQASGLGDLLTVSVSGVEGIQLVERDRLADATRELELTALSAAEGSLKRIQLAKLLGADVLLMAADEQPVGDQKPHVRIIIADAGTGTRLRVLRLPEGGKPDETAAQVVEAIAETRAAFAGGVKLIVGVPQFLSRDLSHERDHLQRGFAALVEGALTSSPGVAVIEIEDARAVRRELELAGDGAVRRGAVPLIVEGEFETVRPPDGGADAAAEPVTKLVVSISDSAKVVQRLELPAGSPADVRRFLTEELPAAVLSLARQKHEPLSPGQQLKALASRADAFARVGAWEQAVALREAALLLDAGASDERRKLTGEYAKLVGSVHRRAEAQRQILRVSRANPRVDPDAFAAVVARRAPHVRHAHRALEHLEFLILNEQVGFRDASKLTEDLLLAKGLLYRLAESRENPDLAPLEDHLRGLVRRVDARMLELAEAEAALGTPGVPTAELLANSWASTKLSAALRLKVVTKADLDFAIEVARKLPPDAKPYELLVNFLERTVAGVVGYGGNGDVAITQQQYQTFLDDLSRVPATRYAIVARLARLWLATDRLNGAPLPLPYGEAPPEHLREEATRLLKAFDALVEDPETLRRKNQYAWLTTVLRVRSISERRGLGPTEQPHVITRDEAPRPEGNPAGPLSYDEVPMKVRELGGRSVITMAQKLRKHSGYRQPGVVGAKIIPCGPGLDVACFRKGVLFHRERGLFDEVLFDEEAEFRDVAWDGRHVWVATGKRGLWVLDTSGRVVERIGEEQGLPAADKGLVILPLGPGRVFAAGAFGEHGRGWCAIVQRRERGGASAAVDVFHKGTRLPSAGEDRKSAVADPEITFTPTWAMRAPPEAPDAAGPIWLGRSVNFNGSLDYTSLLRVDPATLRVTVVAGRYYSSDPPSCMVRPEVALVQNGGKVLQHSFGDPFPGGRRQRLVLDAYPVNWLANPPTVVVHEGRHYVPGPHWFEIDPKGLTARRLGPGIRIGGQLVHTGIHYVTSGVCGLTAWNDNATTCYPISLDPAMPLRVKATLDPEGPRGNAAGDRVERFSGGEVRTVLETLREFRSGGGSFRVDESRKEPSFTVVNAVPVPDEEKMRHLVNRLNSHPEELERIGASAEQVRRLSAAVARRRQGYFACDPARAAKLWRTYNEAPAGPAREAARDAIFAYARELGEQKVREGQDFVDEVKSTLTAAQLVALTFDDPVPTRDALD